MHPLLIPIVMPVILAGLTAGEYALCRVVGRTTSTAQRVYGLAFYAAPFLAYFFMQRRVALFEWSLTNPLHWIAAAAVIGALTIGVQHLGRLLASFLNYEKSVAPGPATFQGTLIVVMPLAILGAPLLMGLLVFAFGRLVRELFGGLDAHEEISVINRISSFDANLHDGPRLGR